MCQGGLALATALNVLPPPFPPGWLISELLLSLAHWRASRLEIRRTPPLCSCGTRPGARGFSMDDGCPSDEISRLDNGHPLAWHGPSGIRWHMRALAFYRLRPLSGLSDCESSRSLSPCDRTSFLSACAIAIAIGAVRCATMQLQVIAGMACLVRFPELI
jgi:hypothetical protein